MYGVSALTDIKIMKDEHTLEHTFIAFCQKSFLALTYSHRNRPQSDVTRCDEICNEFKETG